MNNDLGHALYMALMELCVEGDAFFFSDHEMDDTTYRIFNYRLCSYSDFMKSGAMECRGHMFRLSDNSPPMLVSLTPSKFFNLNENPMSTLESFDWSGVASLTDKRDGSLISTYWHNGGVRLKSKGSLASDQAVESMLLLETDGYSDFKSDLTVASLTGMTVNMEYTSPTNRIVMSYEEPELRVFGVRNNIDGSEFTRHGVKELFPHIYDKWVDVPEMPADMTAFLEAYTSEENKEGYVIQFSDGRGVKLKTEWYFIRHRIKDTISNDKHLFHAIITDAIDDALSLFADDPIVINRINTMTTRVMPRYNNMISVVEMYATANKNLDRKEYAIKAKTLPDGYLGLCMKLYDSKTPDYQGFAMKRHTDFTDA